VQIGSLLRRDTELQLPHAGCGSDSATAERKGDSGHVLECLTIFLEDRHEDISLQIPDHEYSEQTRHSMMVGARSNA
jgi:hypothetical protein